MVSYKVHTTRARRRCTVDYEQWNNRNGLLLTSCIRYSGLVGVQEVVRAWKLEHREKNGSSGCGHSAFTTDTVHRSGDHYPDHRALTFPTIKHTKNAKLSLKLWFGQSSWVREGDRQPNFSSAKDAGTRKRTYDAREVPKLVNGVAKVTINLSRVRQQDLTAHNETLDNL